MCSCRSGRNKGKGAESGINKIQGDWDYLKLKDLLQELDTGEFDLELTGFDIGEIEDLMTQFHVPEEEPEFIEDIASDIKTAICPECGHEFPI